MKANLGKIDRIVRILMAVVIIALYLTDIIAGKTAIILLVLSGILLLTSIVRFCPLYFPFNISTTKKEK